MKMFCLLLFLGAGLVSASEFGDRVWVSFDGGSVAVIVQELAKKGVRLRLDHFKSGDEIAVAQVPRARLDDLTDLFHTHFNRCGGYVVHNNALEAHRVKTIHALRKRTTAVEKRVAYTLDNPDGVAMLLENMDEAEVLSVIDHLSSYQNRFYNSQSGVDAAVWLRDHWLALTENLNGVSARLYAHSFLQPSVILTIQGTEFPDEIVVMGAHLDSTASGSVSPGADDDASGIACLTEVIRTMGLAGFQPKRTVQFMGYAGEERGLLGSRDIAADYSAQSLNVVGVLQLDMTNYQGSSQDIWIIQDFTNAPQNSFLASLVDTYLPGITHATTSCGYGCSDHAAWHGEGFPASLPFESRFGEYNPSIHTSGDTLAVSGNHAFHALKFAKLGACYLAELAKGERQVAPATHEAQVDLPLLTQILTSYGPCPEGPCPYDFNDDGNVDHDDLASLFPEWAGVSCFDFGDGPDCALRPR